MAFDDGIDARGRCVGCALSVAFVLRNFDGQPELLAPWRGSPGHVRMREIILWNSDAPKSPC